MSSAPVTEPPGRHTVAPRHLELARPGPHRDDRLAIDTSGRTRASREPVRVALCAATDVVSHGLAAVLKDFSDRVVLVDLRRLPPPLVDVVLVDFSLDLTAGSRHVRHLRGAGFTSVLGLGPSHTPSLNDLLRDAGACGFVSMSRSGSELVAVLEGVHARRRTPRPALVGPHLWQVEATRQAGCSGREAQVLGLVCRGLSNTEIADELCVSINTVKTYIRVAYRKIDLTRRTQVIAWGHRHGL